MKSLLVYFALSLVFVSGNLYAAAIGISWQGSVYRIDETSGDVNYIGDSGFWGLNSLAMNSDGEIYSVDYYHNLIKINPTTGVGQSIVRINTGNSVTGLAFSDDDTLFGVVYSGRTNLSKIDTTTGIVTAVLGVGGPLVPLQSIAISPVGTAYIWDLNKGLLSIDLHTRSIKYINQSLGGINLQTIDFAPDGTLYGASEDGLYKININTGIATSIKNIDYPDIRGIVFIPEPAISSMLVLGGIAFVKRRK